MHYLIRVRGSLDPSWGAWFAPLSVGLADPGTTVLSGPLPDQAALYAVLLRIDRLGLTLLALQCQDRSDEAQALPETG